jgi:2-polyprenyl-3-methyl-5-hydroxy-6-metoxy-1,4-benzoquinol methylase
MGYKTVTQCRVCGSPDLHPYLDFGNVPLANKLVTDGSSPDTYPLRVLFCKYCALSQLSIVVDPKVLYSNYPYHSSVSATFKKHCREMAVTIKGILNGRFKPVEVNDPIRGDSWAQDSIQHPHLLDIAANDGCLMNEFEEEGYFVSGVEPSSNLCEEYRRKRMQRIRLGSSMQNEFWGRSALKTVKSGWGIDVVTALNVLAHVDDVEEFILCAKEALRRSDELGMMVVEVPYARNLIEDNQFDTIYHEHLSYFLFKPLQKIFAKCGIPIFRVEQHNIHGGSLRVYASEYWYPVEDSVTQLLAQEEADGLHRLEKYQVMRFRAEKTMADLRDLLKRLNSEGKIVAGYGASAKGISLLNYAGLDDRFIHYIVDETPDKQWTFTPGSHIPIADPDHFSKIYPDYILILAWNFQKELMDKTRWHAESGGRYIIPIPEVKVL